MHDGIEGEHAREGSVFDIKSKEVAEVERDSRVEAPRLLNHPWREVESQDIQPLVVEIACDVTGAASQIARRAAPAEGRSSKPALGRKGGGAQAT